MNYLLQRNISSEGGAMRFRQQGLLAGMMCLAMMAGMALSPLTDVQAEVRTPVVPENVPSGSLQSVPILQDIAATLRQIDGRLARLEGMAIKASSSSGR